VDFRIFRPSDDLVNNRRRLRHDCDALWRLPSITIGTRCRGRTRLTLRFRQRIEKASLRRGDLDNLHLRCATLWTNDILRIQTTLDNTRSDDWIICSYNIIQALETSICPRTYRKMATARPNYKSDVFQRETHTSCPFLNKFLNKCSAGNKGFVHIWRFFNSSSCDFPLSTINFDGSTPSQHSLLSKHPSIPSS
jgi:hypothetical protein